MADISDDVRKGVTNARFNDRNSTILFGEILCIAIVAGMLCRSWWTFGGVFIGLCIILYIPVLSGILLVILSLFWGFFGYALGALFQSTAAMVVLGILGFFTGLGVHLSGRQWARDAD
jgi:hypothetical protein